jgi:hypothetical protein
MGGAIRLLRPCRVSQVQEEPDLATFRGSLVEPVAAGSQQVPHCPVAGEHVSCQPVVAVGLSPPRRPRSRVCDQAAPVQQPAADPAHQHRRLIGVRGGLTDAVIIMTIICMTGDVVGLAVGDVVPADVRLLRADALACDCFAPMRSRATNPCPPASRWWRRSSGAVPGGSRNATSWSSGWSQSRARACRPDPLSNQARRITRTG